MGIINKTRRSATVVNNSIKPLCLLGFDKQSYYDIQGMPLTKERSVDYLKENVDVFAKLNYQFNLVNFKLEDYMLINYRRSLLFFCFSNCSYVRFILILIQRSVDLSR